MKSVIAFFAGCVMAWGLMISGMVNPQKVTGFLDIAGTFDPSLAFVMIGALFIAIPGFALARTLGKPLCTSSFDQPAASKVDSRLLLGAAMFGVGWGLAGFCPGPAIVSASLGYSKSVFFLLAMLLGMLAAKRFSQKRLLSK